MAEIGNVFEKTFSSYSIHNPLIPDQRAVCSLKTWIYRFMPRMEEAIQPVLSWPLLSVKRTSTKCLPDAES